MVRDDWRKRVVAQLSERHGLDAVLALTVFASSTLGWFAGALVTVLLGLACVSDVRSRRIPNPLVLAVGAVGVLYSVASASAITTGLLHSVGGMAIGLGIWLPFWLLRWLGAGDVKLFSAAGASLGFWHTLEAAAMAALAGAVLSVGWMLWQYGMRRTVETFALATVSPRILDRPQESVRDSQRHIPYCLALAVGLLVAGWCPKLLF